MHAHDLITRCATGRDSKTLWTAPPNTWLKVKIYAFIMPNFNNVGIALIVCNNLGTVLEAMAYIEKARDVDQAESIGLSK